MNNGFGHPQFRSTVTTIREAHFFFIDQHWSVNVAPCHLRGNNVVIMYQPSADLGRFLGNNVISRILATFIVTLPVNVITLHLFTRNLSSKDSSYSCCSCKNIFSHKSRLSRVNLQPLQIPYYCCRMFSYLTNTELR